MAILYILTQKQIREAAYEIFDRLSHANYYKFHTSEDIARMIEAHCELRTVTGTERRDGIVGAQREWFSSDTRRKEK